jgi:replicative DNA helicase
MNKETALILAKTRIQEYLASQFGVKRINKNFRCLNPTHEDKNPSMSYDNRRYKVHCFSCNADYDIFDLYAIKNNFTQNSKEVFEAVYNWLGISTDKAKSNNSSFKDNNNTISSVPNESRDSGTDYKQFFIEAQKNLSDQDCLKYLGNRGISQETAKKYGLGFVKDWQSPKGLLKNKNLPKTPRVIIPTSDYSYATRDIRGELPEDQKKYSKTKEGNVNIFNAKALKEESPCFVTEGEFDALSFLELGYNAVSLGSASNTRKFLKKIKELSNSCSLIIVLDADESGKKATEQLLSGLQELNINFIAPEIKVSDGGEVYRSEFYGDYKDANDFLFKDKIGFKKEIKKALSDLENWISTEVQAKLEEINIKKFEYIDTNISNQISLFKEWVDFGRNKKVISTGFHNLGTHLDGGVHEGLYVIGAISSLGKTTFMIQIADYISSQGQDVLYISLEMSKYEIMAKSISRHTLLLFDGQESNLAKTTRGITVGSNYDHYIELEIDAINEAIKEYKNQSKNLWITEGLGNIGATEIREVVKLHQQFTDNVPVVIIDYLQILAPYERLSEKQSIDKTVMELKRISRDFKIPILVISSLNRMSYKDKVTMEAFKESGGIEYSADVLFGLQLEGLGNSGFDVDDAKSKNPRKIELKILKNRNGSTGTTVYFEYYPKFNYFKQGSQNFMDFNNAVDQKTTKKNR